MTWQNLKTVLAALLGTLFLTQAAAVKAQEQPNANRGAQLRDLNNQLLQVYGRFLGLGAGSAGLLQSQAATVIGQRAEVLEALVRENPEEALSFAFSAELLGALAKSFPRSAGELESVGEWSGPLEVTVEDGRDLISHRTRHRIGLSDGATYNLYFAGDEPPDLQSGAVLRFRGMRVRSEIAADGGTVSVTSPGAPVMCPTLGAQKSIVLLVYEPGTTPPNMSAAWVHDIFFGATGRSVSQFWLENSYGQAWAEGDVRGWYPLDQNYSCDQYPDIRDAAIRAADADVDFSQYSRVFVIMAGVTGCPFAGIANVGCGSTIHSADGDFVMSAAWMLSDYFFNHDHGVELAIHEGGHNLGLNHASSRSFQGEPLGPPGTAGTVAEYGDVLSAMGFSNMGHYAAPHKVKLGWMRDYLTVSANGSFVLQPAEFASNLQALKIQRGTDPSKFLWVESRKNVGLFDTSLPSNVYTGGLIHYEDSLTGSRSELLDFTPGTSSFSDAALQDSWTDPYTNVSLAIENGDPGALGVTVSYGPEPCIESAPLVSLSPQNPSVYPGEIASYSVTIDNQDSPTCLPRTFALSSLLPGTWQTAFSDGLISLSPGTSSSTIMSKAIPPDALPATYPVNAIGSGDGLSSTAVANVTVAPAIVCEETSPTLSLSPSNTSASPGDDLLFMLKVTNNDSSACSPRTFNLSSNLPTSWPTAFASSALTISPGSSGDTMMQKSIPASATTGDYVLNAVATAGGNSWSAAAFVTVEPAVEPFSITTAVPSVPVQPNSTVTMAARVTVGSAPVYRATVIFTLTSPKGSQTKKATTDLNGNAIWSYKVNPKAGTGNYTLSAQATYDGQTATSSPATFVVQ